MQPTDYLWWWQLLETDYEYQDALTWQQSLVCLLIAVVLLAAVYALWVVVERALL